MLSVFGVTKGGERDGYLVLAFAAGFAERLVLGQFSRFGDKPAPKTGE